jgi:hypothetical protein
MIVLRAWAFEVTPSVTGLQTMFWLGFIGNEKSYISRG